MSSEPAFYLDFDRPEAYLAAERVLQVLPGPCEWIPVRARELPGRIEGGVADPAAQRAALEAGAAAQGLQAARWPQPFPFDSDEALRVATYAKQIGKVVAFTLAALRQAYAGGHALDDRDVIVIAAAACEMHPTAVLKAIELRSVEAALADATALAAQRGVRDVPTVWIPGAGTFHGNAELERAAGALAPA